MVGPSGVPTVVAEEFAYISRAHGVDVARSHVRTGSPAHEILAVAREIGAEMLVLGSRGRGAVRSAVLGSVSQDVVHGATVPVLVMRGPSWAWPPSHVVVGDDASPAALGMLPLAAGIAGLYGSRLTLVHALQNLQDELRDNHELTGHAVDDVLGFAQSELESHVATLPPDVAARAAVRISTEDAAEALVGAPEAAQRGLIVVGSRGLGAVGRIRFGSVSTGVLHRAHGPVLVGPHAARAPAAVVPRSIRALTSRPISVYHAGTS